MSHFLLIIHLLFSDGCRMKDGEDNKWEWKPQQEPSYGKKVSKKQSVHPPLNMYRIRQDWSTYLIFTTVFWWLSFIPVSVFRLKKEDKEKNSKDASEGDREKNTAGEQPWWGIQR